MKIVVAPQGLKGSLDAPAVAAAIARGIAAVLPKAEVLLVPVADGGEGTVRALVAATGGDLRRATVNGPLGEPVAAEYGVLGQQEADATRTAVIEMAAASGLPLLSPAARDPLRASTRGTGELLLAALDAGCTRVIMGIGGSATNDGGAGMAQALGVRLLDAAGVDLPPGGAALARLARIDTSGRDPRLAATKIRVACDVSNPLLGPEGASAVYGPQKGATPEAVRVLDAALAHFADIVRQDLHVDVRDVPGAGAAGGLGAGLLAFAPATLEPGARLVLDTLDFAAKLAGASLVISAEGQLDRQTAYGKSVGAVVAAAHAHGAITVVLAGRVAMDDAELRALGIDAAVPLADGPLSIEESMARATELVASATARALRLLVLGRSLPLSLE